MEEEEEETRKMCAREAQLNRKHDELDARQPQNSFFGMSTAVAAAAAANVINVK